MYRKAWNYYTESSEVENFVYQNRSYVDGS